MLGRADNRLREWINIIYVSQDSHDQQEELYSICARGECRDENLASNRAAGSVMDVENTVYIIICSVMYVKNAIRYFSPMRREDYDTI